ncbi:MAG: hypothetical protein D6767_03125 [Candidatus Hydrogenedentota bacterium]|nr:MAG: hypothetical protein D6767_03125 [Candidatus Hydrogenedentota bacterium]
MQLVPIRKWVESNLSLRDFSKKILFLGDSNVFYVSHFVMFQAALLLPKILVIDCAIRFQLNVLVELALQESIMLEPFLEKIYIQRAFTPYQTVKAAKLAKNSSFPTVFFLAPAKQILDPEVVPEESVFLLQKLYAEFATYPNLFIAEKQEYPNPVFKGTLSLLQKSVEEHWTLWKSKASIQRKIAAVLRNPEQAFSPSLRITGNIGGRYGKNTPTLFKAHRKF